MAKFCPNARKKQVKNAGKIIRTEHRCDTVCRICHGNVEVTQCPNCEGAGLWRGAPCPTCATFGLVPDYHTLQRGLVPA
jgi:hypothetical protein